MDVERLAEIRARCEAATPGPWTAVHWGPDPVDWEVLAGPDVGSERVFESGSGEDGYHPLADEWDVLFIAHARTDIPDLLAEVDRLRAVRDGEGTEEG